MRWWRMPASHGASRNSHERNTASLLWRIIDLELTDETETVSRQQIGGALIVSIKASFGTSPFPTGQRGAANGPSTTAHFCLLCHECKYPDSSLF
ncbi:MAG: hypothetical protein ACRES7_06065 [Gammaproteobacteria bacterium]